MIRINDDYGILVDDCNYTVVRDLHRMDRRKNRDGTYTEYPAYKDLGYYSTLHTALKGLYRRMVVDKLCDNDESLSEAVEQMREIERRLEEKLDEVIPDWRDG